MSLREYLQLLRDGRWWITGGLLLGVGSGLVIALSSTPVYSATTTVYLAAIEGGGEPGQAYQGSLLAEQKARAYAQLLGNDRVRAEVEADIGEPVPQGTITAQATPGSSVLSLEARAPSPERARLIADLAADKAANLVSELERPRDPMLSTVITLRVVEPAALPQTPVAPNVAGLVAIGAVLGAAAGVAVALVRRALDRSIRRADTLEALVDAPLLGTIPFDRSSRTRPVLLPDRPRGPVAEAVRRLRTNLSFAATSRDRNSLLVTSATAGEGKTSLLCDLAAAYGLEGRRVLLVDADLRRPRVAEHLGLDARSGLTTVLVGGCRLPDAVVEWGDGLFDVLPSGPAPRNPSELLTSRRTRDLLTEVERRYDIVLVDGPAVLPVTDSAVLAACCGGTLLVVRHGHTSDAEVTAAAAALRTVRATVVGTVLTMVPRSAAPVGTHAYYSTTRDPLGPNALVTLGPEAVRSATHDAAYTTAERAGEPMAIDETGFDHAATPSASDVDTTDRKSNTDVTAGRVTGPDAASAGNSKPASDEPASAGATAPRPSPVQRTKHQHNDAARDEA